MAKRRPNPNLTPAANRLLGTTFLDLEEEQRRSVPKRFRSFQGFERFGPASVERKFNPLSNPNRTPAENRAGEAAFNQNLLAEKIKFVNPGLDAAGQQELVDLHNRLTALESSGRDTRGVARPLLNRLERVPNREGELPARIRLNAPSRTFGREESGQPAPLLPNIGGKEGAKIGSDIVSGTVLNRAGINALIEFTQRGGPVNSRTGAAVGEGRR